MNQTRKLVKIYKQSGGAGNQIWKYKRSKHTSFFHLMTNEFEDFQLSQSAVTLLNKLIKFALSQVINQSLSDTNQINTKSLKNAMLETMPGELGPYTIASAEDVLTHTDKSVQKAKKLVKEFTKYNNLNNKTWVYLAGMIQYLVSEIIVHSIRLIKEKRKRRITDKYIIKAILQYDEELAKFFNMYTRL